MVDAMLHLLEDALSRAIVSLDAASAARLAWVYAWTLVCLAAVGLGGWKAFIRPIRDRIWTCKGILTLIPYQMLLKNQRLRESLIQKRITRALQ